MVRSFTCTGVQPLMLHDTLHPTLLQLDFSAPSFLNKVTSHFPVKEWN